MYSSCKVYVPSSLPSTDSSTNRSLFLRDSVALWIWSFSTWSGTNWNGTYLFHGYIPSSLPGRGNAVYFYCCLVTRVKAKAIATQLCLTLCNPMDYNLPGFSVHGILQAKILAWVVISFSRGSSQPRGRTWVSGIAGRLFSIWVSSVTKLYPVLCNPMGSRVSGFSVLHCIPQFAQIHVHLVSGTI